VERLEEQMRLLFNIPFAAKLGGAEITMHTMWLIHKSTGENLEEPLLKKTWLHHSFPTQIEHYDHFAAFFDALKRINHYHRFRQRYLDLCFHGIFQTRGEIGSSAMPHSKPD
jgi:adenylosuccinate lyase